MRRVDVPKSLVSLVEGESLLNDASSLIVFRFALATVLTGQFQFHQAAVNFVLVILVGILIGLVVGLIFYGIHRLLPTTSNIEIVLTLVTPYCMYYAAEHFQVSGVLAVVSGGLLLSSKRDQMLSYRSRIEGLNVGKYVAYDSLPKSFWQNRQAHQLHPPEQYENFFVEYNMSNAPIYGYCAQPLDERCDKFRACYTCRCFVAAPNKLPQYIELRDKLEKKSSEALKQGQDVLVEQFNVQVVQLDKIIAGLEGRV